MGRQGNVKRKYKKKKRLTLEIKDQNNVGSLKVRMMHSCKRRLQDMIEFEKKKPADS